LRNTGLAEKTRQEGDHERFCMCSRALKFSWQPTDYFSGCLPYKLALTSQ